MVDRYDDNIERRKKYRRELSYNLLRKAFKEMDPDDTGRISRDAIMALIIILNEDYPEIRNLSEDEAKIMFGFLDKDGSSSTCTHIKMRFALIVRRILEKSSSL